MCNDLFAVEHLLIVSVIRPYHTFALMPYYCSSHVTSSSGCQANALYLQFQETEFGGKKCFSSASEPAVLEKRKKVENGDEVGATACNFCIHYTFFLIYFLPLDLLSLFLFFSTSLLWNCSLRTAGAKDRIRTVTDFWIRREWWQT